MVSLSHQHCVIFCRGVSNVRQVLSILWPPYELYLATRAKQVQSCSGTWEQSLEKLKIEISGKSKEDIADAEKIASSVLDAEAKRKDVLEAKATTFIVPPTVATAITAAIAPLTKDLGLSGFVATLITISYTIALVHLLVSSWYAISARRAEGFVVISSTNALDLISKSPVERIAERLNYARLNEPALLIKSNRLSVSEDLFLRGLAFLAFAACLTLFAHIARV